MNLNFSKLETRKNNYILLIKKTNKHFYTYVINSNRILFSFSTLSKLFRRSLLFYLYYRPIYYRNIYIYSYMLTNILSARNISSLIFKCNYPFKSRVKFLFNFLKSNSFIVN
ncbi:hypothetical protein [Candidatus Vidania fulgoroideorum]